MIRIRNYSTVHTINCFARCISDSLVVSMSRLSVILSLTGVALSASPVDFRSPLTVGARGGLVTNVLVDDVPRSARLTFGYSTSLPSSIWSVHIAFRDVEAPSTVYALEVAGIDHSEHENSHFFNIGSQSVLTQHAGAVSVIRQSSTYAELVIA